MMRSAAQLGTALWALVGALAVHGCDDGVADDRDAALVDARAADAHTADAHALQCTLHSDCVVVNPGPCGFCSPPRKEQVLALSVAEAAARTNPHGEVACAPCPPPSYDPLAPAVEAACVAGRCMVIDLREQEFSACSSDSECEAVSKGCCPACGGDPSAYVGQRSGADASVLACFPIPSCAPCTATRPAPRAYCAADRHCAVAAGAADAAVP